MSGGEPVAVAVADALQGWSGGGRIFVGYSGGMDSSVLLHAASRLQPGAVVALHVNHGLQPGAASWDVHCKTQCVAWRVPLRCRVAAVSPRGNVEAAARDARYDFFASQVGAGDVLLLAHHRDDQVETLLLRLVQGRGFYAIPRQRQLSARRRSPGRLVRPLLGLPRQVLLEYARSEGLQWVEDPSNAELDRDRNYLRHQVLPGLRQRWPDLDGALLEALAGRHNADRALLGALAAGGSRLALQRLPRDVDAAVEALRIWLASRGQQLPTKAALHDFFLQLSAPADRQPVLAVGAGSLRRYAGHVYAVGPLPVVAASYSLALPGSVKLPHGQLTAALAQADGFVPGADVAVQFAAAHPGARLLVRGHRRRVRELLQAARVPPWRRDTYPLIVDAEGVAALPGIAHRDPGRRSPSTARYVCNWIEFEELH